MKMVVIDDEVLVRRGILSSVDWESNDIEVAGEAADGRSGLELIRAVQPDLVLTDIRMPHMNGLEMMNQVKAEFPDIRFIILSVLEDFPTVREALRLGAVDYMNKFRMDSDELLQSVLKIKDRFVPKSGAVSHERTKVKSQTVTMQEDGLDWLKGAENETYDRQFEAGGHYVVAELECYKARSGLGIKSSELAGMLDEYALNDSGIICMFMHENRSGWTLLCRMIAPAPFEEESAGAALKWMEALRHACRDIFSCGISRVFKRGADRTEAYREAQSALSLVFYRGNGVYAYTPELRTGTHSDAAFMEMGVFRQYLLHLEGYDDDAAAKAFQELFPETLKEEVKITEVLDAVHSWVSSVILVLKDWGGQVPISMHQESVFEQLRSRGTYHELRVWCYQLHLLAREMVVDLKKAAHNRPEVQRAMDYIKEHYAEQIRVQDVAQVVNLSENYFSNLFTKEAGKTFSQYIQEIRIEKAKELLRGRRLEWFEVGELVGMENPKYFSKMFKKYTGCTPIQYMNQNK